MSLVDEIILLDKTLNESQDNATAVKIKKKLTNEFLFDVSSENAQKIYNELCIMYIETMNADVDKRRELFSSELSLKCLKFLLETGLFIDRLVDACELSPKCRREKWALEDDVNKAFSENHKRNSVENEKWSLFIFQSRTENRNAYTEVKEYLQKKENGTESWQFVILLHSTVLMTKDASFFYGIMTSKLSTQQKRAILYKLNLIYNHLPKPTRIMIHELSEDLFRIHVKGENHTEIEDVESHSFEIKTKNNVEVKNVESKPEKNVSVQSLQTQNPEIEIKSMHSCCAIS
jgi:hypothetical protein